MFNAKQKRIICIVVAAAMIVPICLSIVGMFLPQ